MSRVLRKPTLSYLKQARLKISLLIHTYISHYNVCCLTKGCFLGGSKRVLQTVQIQTIQR